MCYNGSKIAAPQLYGGSSTLSSCMDLPIQYLFLGIYIDTGLTIYRLDTKDAYTYSTAHNNTYFTIDNAYTECLCSKFVCDKIFMGDKQIIFIAS